MEHLDFVQTIIEGGAVGIAVLTLCILYRLVCMAGTLAGNHLQHIAEALGGIDSKLDIIINTPPHAGPRGRKGEKGDPGTGT
jgi:hypothetical protein